MLNYKIASSDEVKFFEEELEKYNLKQKPLQQEEEFITFKHAAEEDGKIVGGIFAYSSYYKIGYIDTLWVDEGYRKKGIGSNLLSKVESDLCHLGCEVIQLATFDFQGPEFYKAQGYKEFGKLYYPNADLNEFYLSKDITSIKSDNEIEPFISKQ